MAAPSIPASILAVAYLPVVAAGGWGGACLLASIGAASWCYVALVAAVAAASFVAEGLLPYDPSWNRSRGDAGRDWLHAAVNETLAFASVGMVPVLAAWTPWPSAWPSAWPMAMQLALACLVADAGITLAHWASHRVEWLWRFHAVHHSVKRFYGLNGLLKHPLHQMIETTAGVAPLLALGLPADVARALAACVAVQLLLQHSNVDARPGLLGKFFAWGDGHRLHHRKWPGEGDVNFGLFTLAWDRMLGTFAWDPSLRPGSDDIGIGARPDYPTAYLQQLAEPFRGGA